MLRFEAVCFSSLVGRSTVVLFGTASDNLGSESGSYSVLFSDH
uniref:Uncharacterized protein n=1 Tax=Rhizophora mucronata TaxID=61149 RepID=A0A2P2MGP8_RHIMU